MKSIQVFIAFLKLGLTSFGGPVSHIGYFRTAFVEKYQWLNENQFSQLFAISQFLPGPASSQLGFCIGLHRAGGFGALAAFLGFTLPSAVLLFLFAIYIPSLSGELFTAVIAGLKIVAFAVVADAVYGMSKSLCNTATKMSIAVISFFILLSFSTVWSNVLVIFIGGFIALLIGLFNSELLHKDAGQANQLSALNISYGKRYGMIFLILFVGLLIGLPMLALNDTSYLMIADIFYRAGALVFGGGHVVLPLLQDAVVTTEIVNKETFIAGYGASQAIPGPMFAFSTYLGAMIGAESHAWFGATLATVFIFLPGFLLILGVLPFWNSLAKNTMAKNAIAGINAAVVGILAAALYDPIFTSAITTMSELVIGICGFLMLAVWRLSTLVVVGWCVLASVALGLF